MRSVNESQCTVSRGRSIVGSAVRACKFRLIALSISIIPIWWMLLFPLVHVAPGLIGHRLFDRNEAVGDARVFRTDFPLWWFVVANHRMTASLLFTLKK